jgi:hypothetical protein
MAGRQLTAYYEKLIPGGNAFSFDRPGGKNGCGVCKKDAV